MEVRNLRTKPVRFGFKLIFNFCFRCPRLSVALVVAKVGCSPTPIYVSAPRSHMQDSYELSIPSEFFTAMQTSSGTHTEKTMVPSIHKCLGEFSNFGPEFSDFLLCLKILKTYPRIPLHLRHDLGQRSQS